MRRIDADKVKAESREHCKTCILNGTKHCKTCVVNLICDRLDLQPTVELTEEDAIDKLHATGWLPKHDKELTTIPDGDLISRDALKKAITLNRNIDRNAVCDVLDIIDNAPTVEEKSYAMGYQDGAEDGLQDIRTPGKWDLHGKRYYCSECGEEAINIESEPDMYSSNYCLTNYCPFCGADMRGKQNAQ